ncbi:hypothetical protein EN858_02055 [Mesorhizobium sp. M4B.F.Ca.ET.215.01.1.1]|uniref:hypothetical protein n=1 Tax=unclassified Mesorhizobium TaxID=325217 RepID=UPI000FCC5E88|nr:MULTISPECIES: hypothetical protein [unclassified Mesorhizobium]RUW22956.1 hypothetical protein EOA34_19800 [Mesorhizobium sp. M4B.F.Ca.ET.013.02.1.1]RUW74631.1 hypothetical protein EOA31_10740 [Mesorhizobium sp. M4B.F.Ca.ET.049.02.1.2]RVD46443.1 hypothetical protein EN741_01100 [Mesorhizobium sp. M4B.F.Ca.ET.019.03.1.1]RWF66562.1 MAG: hypothetical protein EOS47_05555 [Mesorhizobium sp.]RWX70959.1 hypothetical protein EN780_01630 [Mesorhizobium sp. M4B.F.Ca.ET.089.01.1.1]
MSATYTDVFDPTICGLPGHNEYEDELKEDWCAYWSACGPLKLWLLYEHTSITGEDLKWKDDGWLERDNR